jgi:hypothetical protein
VHHSRLFYFIFKIHHMKWRFNKKEMPVEEQESMPQVSRRRFLGFAGLGAGVLAVGAQGCDKDDDDGDGVSFGSGDVAILNYAYALEQLEAAFYTRVVASSGTGLSVAETAYMNDIMKHEVAHREFLKNALGSNAIPSLDINFSTIDFSTRTGILTAARTFEDTGVAAYNGAGRYITSAAYLGLAGKIVSVEARHAAIIRNLLATNGFADDSLFTGAKSTTRQDVALKPRAVISAVAPFVRTKLNVNSLPA